MNLPTKAELMREKDPEVCALREAVEKTVAEYSYRLTEGGTVYVDFSKMSASTASNIEYEILAGHPDYRVSVNYKLKRIAIWLT